MSDAAATQAIRERVQTSMLGKSRWSRLEIAFWLAIAISPFLFPARHLLLNEVAILALFALSLDLVLGYAGIVTLGHAAFFGTGAFAAGLFAIHVNGDPLLGLLVAGIAAGCIGFVSSFLVLRGADLTRLMVTLGVALVLGEIANKNAWATGGADGLQGIVMKPVLGLFSFDLFGTTACFYSLAVLFVCFCFARRLVHSPFGLSLRSIRDNSLRARAVGIPVNRRLVVLYTIAAVMAGISGGLLAQTTQFVSLDVLEFHRSADIMLVLVLGGAGTLYGGLAGAIAFTVLKDVLSGITPQYWQFWIGLVLVVLVLVGRERINGWASKSLTFVASWLPSQKGA